MPRISARVVRALLAMLGVGFLTRDRRRPSPPRAPDREDAGGPGHPPDPSLPAEAFTMESGFSAARQLHRRLKESRWIAPGPKVQEEGGPKIPQTGQSSDKGKEEPR